MPQAENLIELNHKRRFGDADDAAALLKVPKSWIYDRTRRNVIPMIRLGKYCRFDLDQLRAWAQAGCPEKW